MKVRVHLRVAQVGRATSGRHKIAATAKPNYGALTDNQNRPLPTVAFAVDLDIDPAAFKAAEHVVATLVIGAEDAVVAAELAP